LGEEVGPRDWRFDPAAVEGVYLKIDDLKQEFDKVEARTSRINKRESLLGGAPTEFRELYEI